MEKIADGESADRSLLAAKPADRGVSAPELASEKNQEMDRMLVRRIIPTACAGDDAGAAEAAYDFDQALGESPVTRLNVFER